MSMIRLPLLAAVVVTATFTSSARAGQPEVLAAQGPAIREGDPEVTASGGDQHRHQTYSIGPVLGYQLFIRRGLHAHLYLRYWPNVATSLEGNEITVAGPNGPVGHRAHDFKLFTNVSIGWAFDG
jgi:hypothetical protein